MDHLNDASSPSLRSSQEYEAVLDDEERDSLEQHARELVDEAFVYRDHRETIETIEPVVLHPHASPDDIYRMLIPKGYTRAFAEMTIDHVGDRSYFGYASVTLVNDQGLMMDGVKLVMNGDDEFPDNGPDTNDPQFYLDSGSGTNMVLDAEFCRHILHEVVKQANPDALLDDTLSLLELMQQLMQKSPETHHRRELSQRFTHTADIGHVVISIIDHHSRISGEQDPQPPTYRLSVAATSLDEGVTTRVNLAADTAKVSSTFSVDYPPYLDDVTDDHYNALVHHEIAAFSNPAVAQPSRFGSKVLNGLRLLADNPDDYEQSSELWD